jgi:hypothetical protein
MSHSEILFESDDSSAWSDSSVDSGSSVDRSDSDMSDNDQSYRGSMPTYPPKDMKLGWQRRAVWEGRALMTRGGLTKSMLTQRNDGRIVSKAASERAGRDADGTRNISEWRDAVMYACNQVDIPYTVPKKGTKLYKCARERYRLTQNGIDLVEPIEGCGEEEEDKPAARRASGRPRTKRPAPTVPPARASKRPRSRPGTVPPARASKRQRSRPGTVPPARASKRPRSSRPGFVKGVGLVEEI